MVCQPCIKDYISCGIDGIAVNGTLLPETNYTWILTSPSYAKYSGNVTTDTDGHFILDTAGIPDMMLNPYAGMFYLKVQTSDCNQATWNDSAYCEPYDCIQFEAVNGNQGKNTLGCPCLEDVDTGCCFPTIIPFTDLLTIDIPYTTQMVGKYGDVPTVQVWVYDNTGRLVNVTLYVAFDAVPATNIFVDFGGLSSGYIVIR